MRSAATNLSNASATVHASQMRKKMAENVIDLASGRHKYSNGTNESTVTAINIREGSSQ